MSLKKLILLARTLTGRTGFICKRAPSGVHGMREHNPDRRPRGGLDGKATGVVRLSKRLSDGTRTKNASVENPAYSSRSRCGTAAVPTTYISRPWYGACAQHSSSRGETAEQKGTLSKLLRARLGHLKINHGDASPCALVSALLWRHQRVPSRTLWWRPSRPSNDQTVPRMSKKGSVVVVVERVEHSAAQFARTTTSP